MELIKAILIFAAILDVLSSVFSFIGAIPAGKPWTIPRFPLLITIIIMILQTKSRHQLHYCENCQKNCHSNEIVRQCIFCGAKTEIKFMNITGRIHYRCSNPSCRTQIIKFCFEKNNRIRTRFSRLQPYSEKTMKKSSLICKTCGKKVNSGKTVNLSVYGQTMLMAQDYREDFFYHGIKPNESFFEVLSLQTATVKKIYLNYEVGPGSSATSGVPTSPVKIYVKTGQKASEKTLFRFRMAVPKSENLRLKNSEGIIILLNGKSDEVARQTVIDHFIVDLQQINTRSAVWKNPILVGICSNGVERLENAIDKGIKSQQEEEKICIEFLKDMNNSDIINRLYSEAENVHFFLYRTGSAAKGTAEKIYNAVQPAQALIYNFQPEMNRIWSKNGYLPLTNGKSQ